MTCQICGESAASTICISCAEERAAHARAKALNRAQAMAQRIQTTTDTKDH